MQSIAAFGAAARSLNALGEGGIGSLLVFAALLAAVPVLFTPSQAHAQNFIEFLWGGGSEQGKNARDSCDLRV